MHVVSHLNWRYISQEWQGYIELSHSTLYCAYFKNLWSFWRFYVDVQVSWITSRTMSMRETSMYKNMVGIASISIWTSVIKTMSNNSEHRRTTGEVKKTVRRSSWWPLEAMGCVWITSSIWHQIGDTKLMWLRNHRETSALNFVSPFYWEALSNERSENRGTL